MIIYVFVLSALNSNSNNFRAHVQRRTTQPWTEGTRIVLRGIFSQAQGHTMNSRTSDAPPGSRTRPGYTKASRHMPPRSSGLTGIGTKRNARTLAITNDPAQTQCPLEEPIPHLPGASPDWPATGYSAQALSGHSATAAQADGSGGRPLHLAFWPREATHQPRSLNRHREGDRRHPPPTSCRRSFGSKPADRDCHNRRPLPARRATRHAL